MADGKPTSSQKMGDNVLHELGLLNLGPAAQAAPAAPAALALKSDSVIALEKSISKLTDNVAALEEELNKMKRKRDLFLEKSEEDGLSEEKKADAEAKFKLYQGLTTEAQAALDKANALLLEKEKLLDNEKNRELEREKLLAQGGKLQASPAELMAALYQALEFAQFPTTAAGYELEDLHLPEDNPNRASVLERQVKKKWNGNGPDFLVTRLEERKVQLHEFDWDETEQQLTFKGGEATTLGDAWEQAALIALVSTSGSGKTRAVWEEGFKNFGIYLSAIVDGDMHGINDLPDVLKTLPQDLPGASQEKIEDLKVQLTEFMHRVILARLAVFHCAKKAFPGLEPKHWLALQLFPGRFTHKEVFTIAMGTANKYEVTHITVKAAWTQEIKFIAIDEAQFANRRLHDVFPSIASSGKRSALSVLLQAITGLPAAKFVLSGTGLEVKSVAEILASSAGKEAGLRTQLLGCTTAFEKSGVQLAVNQCGYQGTVDLETLSRFCGRPRFAMRLAEALIMGQDIGTLEEAIIGGLKVQLKKLTSKPVGDPFNGKRVYGEFRNAAARWILRGDGGVLKNGALGLENGVCALRKTKEKTGVTAFFICEPLVV